MKKVIALTFAALLSVTAVGPVLADADDVAWINKCVSDNKDQGQTTATIMTYCTCMNNQMSSSDTKSITAWEKSHPKEVEDCAKQAGWQGK